MAAPITPKHCLTSDWKLYWDCMLKTTEYLEAVDSTETVDCEENV